MVTWMNGAAAAMRMGWPAVAAATTAKSLLLLALAAGLALGFRRASAATRHLVWATAVTGLLVLPVLAVVGPRWPIPLPGGLSRAVDRMVGEAARGGRGAVEPSDVTERPATGTSPVAGSRGEVEQEAPGPWAASRSADPGEVLARGDYVAGQGAPSWKVDWRVGAGLVWLGGLLAGLLTLAAGLLGLKRIGARARPAAPRVQAAASQAARRLGLRRRVTLLEADGPIMPMTWGVLRPVVLLPAGARSWPATRLEAVLLHELAHVRRRDPMTQVVTELACAVHWFNPAAWLAARCLRVEREHACDDAVLRAGATPSDYAGQLLAVVRSLRPASMVAVGATAMARSSQLAGRLLAVLDQRRNRAGVTPARAWATAACFAIAVPAIAAAAPQRPAPSAPVVAQAPAAPVPRATPPPETAAVPTPPALPAAASAPLQATATAPAMAAAPPVAAAPAVAVPPVKTPVQPMASAPVTTPAAPPSEPGLPAVPTSAAAGAGGGRPSSVDLPCHGNSSHLSENDNGKHRLIIWSDGGDCRVVVNVRGDVRFTDELDGIASVPVGGSLSIDAKVDGDHRELDVTPGASGPQYDYRIDGQRRPFDAAGRAWLHDTLVGLARTTGLAADQRVSSLLRQGGAAAVLAELGQINSDYVLRVYIEELLQQTKLSPQQVRRVIDLAGRRIHSDYQLANSLMAVAKEYPLDNETRSAFIAASGGIRSDYQHARVLTFALTQSSLTPEDVSALLSSAQSIHSDYQLATLLTEVASRYAVQPASLAALLRASSSLSSDYQKSRVLEALLAHEELNAGGQAEVLRQAASIHSDAQLAGVLASAKLDLGNAAVQQAYLRAAGTLDSGYEHARVLKSLAARKDATPQTLALVLESAGSIHSDFQRADLLVTIARSHRLEGALRDTYMKSANDISSSYQRHRALDALLSSTGETRER